MPKQFYPINDRVSVFPDDGEQQSEGGIVLTDSAKGPTLEGIVSAVGSGHLTQNGDRVPLRVKPGDRIVYLRQGSLELACGSEKIHVINEAQIVGLSSE